ADSGDYAVTITNGYGSVTSRVATVLVALPPQITRQPISQVVASGGAVSLLVTAAGAGPLSYRWQFNGSNLPADMISTVAGGGVGDGRAATNATVMQPTGVAWDSAGNFYFTDSGNRRVRKVDAHGIISTVAGNGGGGYAGDGGAATNASLGYPAGLALDAAGNLFIADQDNNRVRKVDTVGIITTVAGDGRFRPDGDGGAATNASLASPLALALDAAGDLFIADQGNNRIRKVQPDGIITTVAGDGTAGYSGDGGAATNASLNQPAGLAVDAAGNLFIADQGNSRVRKLDTNGILTTVAGAGRFAFSGDGGAATNASLSNPAGLAMDTAGDLYLADQGNNRIRKVDTRGIITTVAGNGQFGYFGDGALATKARLNSPSSVAVDRAGKLLIVDQFNNLVRGVDTNGIISTVAGSWTASVYDGGPATEAALRSPAGVAVDTSGNLFIADTWNNRIRKVQPDGLITTVAGGEMFGYVGDGGAATNAGLASPSGVAVDAAGDLFIADTWNNRIRKVQPNGIIRTVAGGGRFGYVGDGGAATNAGLASPLGVAVDSSGNLFIADTGDSRVRKVDTHGMITTAAGNGQCGYYGDGGAATNAALCRPGGVAVDTAGNVFIADQGNNCVRKVDSQGNITTVAGNGSAGYFGDGGAATNAGLGYPTGLALDTAGNMFIADTWNNRIRKVDPDGIITTVAGDGRSGYSGDGGAATNASLANPSGVAARGPGNFFIADTQNSRVRKVLLSDLPLLTLGSVSAADAGDYWVIVSNPFGSVTSLVATVTIGTPPLTLSLEVGPPVLVRLSGSPGMAYLLQAATNLVPPVQWQSIFTNATDLNGTSSLLDTNAAGLPARFYRAQPVP
ncbi:MAG: SMP-30/gluconolactonase/LRE family protein, partial [Verrucomicrobia bacterium]|nr:SMP-30/gluconolactonase/LRE family protein [Verrucomicrobiota bacterium]